MTSESSTNVATTSTGSSLSEANYLDARFLAAQAEYEAMLRWAEVEKSWHVLDAGSGSGTYLPLLCELVGETGSIAALDLAPENVRACQDRLNKLNKVETKVGSVSQVPFGDAQFDAVWCANTSQYLSDEELTTTLSEFKRVTRRGGLVVVKEADVTCLQFAHIDPAVMWRYLDCASRNNSQVAGVMRTINLPAWFRKAGLVNVRSKTFIIERSAPLKPIEKIALGDLTEFFAKSALISDLPEYDLSQWRLFLNMLTEANLLESSDFFFREAAVVVAGEVI
jgi:ubiquinone/menaquinone biosynthesis C-methylase UbiE